MFSFNLTSKVVAPSSIGTSNPDEMMSKLAEAISVVQAGTSFEADKVDSYDIGNAIDKLVIRSADKGLLNFVVCGFGECPWRIETRTELCIFMEQSRELGEFLFESTSTECEVDFYEQGIEKLLTFRKLPSDAHHIEIHCKPFDDARKIEHDVETIPLHAIRSMYATLMSTLFIHLITVYPERMNNILPIWHWLIGWYRTEQK